MTFHFSESAKQGNKALAGCIVVVLVAVVAMLLLTDFVAGITRIGVILMLLGGGLWNGLSFARSAFASDPVLTINDEGIMVSGWQPDTHANNWATVLAWKDFGQIVLNKKSTLLTLVFYHPKDTAYIVKTIEHFQSFDNQEQILQLLAEKTGRPVTVEKV